MFPAMETDCSEILLEATEVGRMLFCFWFEVGSLRGISSRTKEQIENRSLPRIGILSTMNSGDSTCLTLAANKLLKQTAISCRHAESDIF